LPNVQTESLANVFEQTDACRHTTYQCTCSNTSRYRSWKIRESL